MASGTLGELNIKIAANVAQLSQDVTKVEREMRKMRMAGVKASKQMDVAAKSITGFKNIAIGVTAVVAGFRTLSNVVGSSLDVFQAQEDAEKKLSAAIGTTSQSLLNQAAALQKVSKFGDEQIIEAQALIGSFVKEESQIKAATKATLDLAAAKGMDLKAAADLVSKTLGSSTNALSRYGIQVEGAVGSSERLESTINSISAVFGGQAAAQADTMSGRIQQMENAFGDLQEMIVSFAAPALTTWATGARVAIEAAQDLVESIREAVSISDRGLQGETFEDMQRRLRQRATAQRQADAAMAKEAREKETKERLAENAKMIEDEQKLWEKRLLGEIANDQMNEKIHQKRVARRQKEIDLERQAVRERQNALRSLVGGLSAALQASTSSFETKKKIATAEALINTYVAISQASTATSNYYVNLALAAAAAATGFARVRAIQSQTIGGGGSALAEGAPTVASIPSQDSSNLLTENQQGAGGGTQTTIVFQGGTFIGGDKDQVARELVPAVEKALQDGQR
jgi:hypothetical protein